MSTAELDQLLEAAIAVALQAGRRIIEIYHSGFRVAQKADSTPLTEADMASHAVIDDGFAEATPQLPIISEESAEIPFSLRSSWQRYWLVDPLDGTREFIRHTGQFTVNIALIEEGQPVLGVVYAPVSDVCYFAVRGRGAWKREGGDKAVVIRARPCGSTVTVVGGCSQSDALDDFLGKIGPYQFIQVGSALKSCLVAEGKADLYARLGPTSEWDTAAAQCIVEEAGGCMTDLQMRPLAYNTKESLLNPHFFVFGDPSRDWSRHLDPRYKNACPY